MWSWKSRGSKSFILCGLLLSLSGLRTLSAQNASVSSPQEANGLSAIKVTLIDITSYGDFQDIRNALLKSEDTQKVSIDSEAPGLVILSVSYNGSGEKLINHLNSLLSGKQTIKGKNLASGRAEIIISQN